MTTKKAFDLKLHHNIVRVCGNFVNLHQFVLFFPIKKVIWRVEIFFLRPIRHRSRYVLLFMFKKWVTSNVNVRVVTSFFFFFVNAIKYEFVYLKKKTVAKKTYLHVFCGVVVCIKRWNEKNIQSISIHIRCAPEAYPSWICWTTIFLFPFMSFFFDKKQTTLAENLKQVPSDVYAWICVGNILVCFAKATELTQFLRFAPQTLHRQLASMWRKHCKRFYREFILWVTNATESVEM